MSELPLIGKDSASEEEGLTPNEKMLHKFIEIARATTAGVAIAMGFTSRYRVFAGLFVIGMDFTLALQIFFLPHLTTRAFKWQGGPFQRQSGCQFLANGTAMIVLLAIHAVDAALAAVVLSSTTYFACGGINHIGSAIYNARRDNRSPVWLHYGRFLGAIALSSVNYYLIFGLWKALS